ncbi:hypothetical protein D9619_008983 [Psilocybe cf. subviscida]|uniref:Uncharacterized protein n=1 Tax=Psilocybe cf. subviscida TaxID=2480587 RepID=A0A8H5BUV2_9AGAR|nr:hypothetical protein D9619_008983 [Psilocybe cf. subviscida]
MFTRFIASFALLAYLSRLVTASPLSSPSYESELLSTNTDILARRTDPVFPDSPPSCPICQQGYPSIQSCAQAAPVLANFSMIIFNPGAFIDVIKCACGDTFQSVFPQCVDCFTQTGQQDVISTSNLPGLVGSIKNICGIESTLLGNVSAVNSANANAPQPTQTSGTRAVAQVSAGNLVASLGLLVVGLVVL